MHLILQSNSNFLTFTLGHCHYLENCHSTETIQLADLLNLTAWAMTQLTERPSTEVKVIYKIALQRFSDGNDDEESSGENSDTISTFFCAYSLFALKQTRRYALAPGKRLPVILTAKFRQRAYNFVKLLITTKSNSLLIYDDFT